MEKKLYYKVGTKATNSIIGKIVDVAANEDICNFQWDLSKNAPFVYTKKDNVACKLFIRENVLNKDMLFNVNDIAYNFVAKAFGKETVVTPAPQPLVKNVVKPAPVMELEKQAPKATEAPVPMKSGIDFEAEYTRLYHENKLLKAQLKQYREKKASTINTDAIVDRALDALSICHIIRVLGEAKDAFIGMSNADKISVCMKRAWAYKKGDIDLTAAILAESITTTEPVKETPVVEAKSKFNIGPKPASPIVTKSVESKSEQPAPIKTQTEIQRGVAPVFKQPVSTTCQPAIVCEVAEENKVSAVMALTKDNNLNSIKVPSLIDLMRDLGSDDDDDIEDYCVTIYPEPKEETKPVEKEQTVSTTKLCIKFNKSNKLCAIMEVLGGGKYKKILEYKNFGTVDDAHKTFGMECKAILKDKAYKGAEISLRKCGIDAIAKSPILRNIAKSNSISFVEEDEAV